MSAHTLPNHGNHGIECSRCRGHGTTSADAGEPCGRCSGAGRIQSALNAPKEAQYKTVDLLSNETRRLIAKVVHTDCTLIPGATFYNAAEMAVNATLAQIAATAAAAPPAPASQSPTEDEEKADFDRWLARVRPSSRGEAVQSRGDAFEALRSALKGIPAVRWTKSRSTVTIPETDNFAGKALHITGLDKQYARSLASYIAAANPAVIADLLARVDTAPQQPAQGWQDIATVSEGNLVVVYWEDQTDPANPERYDFDYLEDGTWMQYLDNYQHMVSVGGHGLKEKAPYTHWMALGKPAINSGPGAEPAQGQDATRLAELVLYAVKNRSDKDYAQMHLDLSEAAEIARAMTATKGA